MRTLVACFTVAADCFSTAPAIAQSDVLPSQRFGWTENAGWLNWRDAGSPTAAQGARVNDTFLSGFVWSENCGWINLGDGTPANAGAYGNVNGADAGVNFDPDTGLLSGFAWGENVGWINFDGGALASPPNPARIEPAGIACRFAGFAWTENIGWINLDDSVHFVGLDPVVCFPPVPGDMNCDGSVSVGDIAGFVLALTDAAGYAAAYPNCDIANGDVNGDGFVTVGDIAPFVVLLTGL